MSNAINDGVSILRVNFDSEAIRPGYIRRTSETLVQSASKAAREASLPFLVYDCGNCHVEGLKEFLTALEIQRIKPGPRTDGLMALLGLGSSITDAELESAVLILEGANKYVLDDATEEQSQDLLYERIASANARLTVTISIV